MRTAAQKLARLCPTLLRPLNPVIEPSNRIEAMRAVLALPIAPEGYAEDVLRCFGLSGEATSMGDLRDSARRLTFGTVDLLMDNIATIGPMIPTDLTAALTDGRLALYIRQTSGAK